MNCIPSRPSSGHTLFHRMRHLPQVIASAILTMLPAVAPAVVVPVADVWHLTGYEFEATSSPASADAEPVSGTATLTEKVAGTTYTLTFDLFGEEESFDLTLTGDRLVGSSTVNVGGGVTEFWKMTLKIVDQNTILLSDIFTTVASGGPYPAEPLSFDAVGGVLTRAPLPTANPTAWAGTFPTRSALNFGTDAGSRGIEEETGDEIEAFTLVAAGGGTYQVFIDGEEDLELDVSGNILTFEESDEDDYVMFEDANWRVEATMFSDRVYVHQLGGGRILVIGNGMEAAKSIFKATSAQRNFLDWADLYLEIAGGPAPVTYSTWASSLGLTGGNADANAKPSADGLPNLVRYAMNLDNSSAPGELPASGIAKVGGVDHITLAFSLRDLMPGVKLEVQQSTDLAANGWSPVPQANVAPIADSDPATTRYRVAVPLAGEPRRFLRLKATETP
ncbi:hypothetical protein OVA24_05950 [Luteolibacter sp. SL250]|uniref:hypothetical protein n=1 Tax=Luteolibacter sp. SL250 TaxID=2995170 RepID=UPI002271D061|nr:hypothetical protein [Luteolibacter sp. SL250]WAC20922.1 hypothetical protein OVA24_05950 [Luteolibacter sp. SL250]